MKRRISNFLILCILSTSIFITNDTGVMAASKKGTYVRSFNSGGYYRAVIIKKFNKKKVTFRMAYSSLRYEGWSNEITATLKGNKAKFTFSEDYTDSEIGTGVLTIKKNFIMLKTQIDGSCLSTDGKKVKIKKQDNTTDYDRY